MPHQTSSAFQIKAIFLGLALAGWAANTLAAQTVKAPAPMTNKQALALEAQAEAGRSATFSLLELPGSAHNPQIVRLANVYGLQHLIIHYHRLAVHWWSMAARQDYTPAMDDLALAYYTGQGTTQLYVVAMQLWGAAARRGDVAGQHNLALCYQHGWGVAANPKKAVFWMGKAAAQGEQSALYTLGNWCAAGYGMKKDLRAAVGYWKKAAARGGQIGTEANAKIAKAAAATK